MDGGAWRPVRAIELTNTTDTRLEGGPVSLMTPAGDHVTPGFAGDARFDGIGPGDTQLLPYALDLELTVEPSMQTRDGSRATVVSGRIADGVLIVTRRDVRTKMYRVSNSGDTPRTLLLELNDEGSYEPTDAAPEPVERVAGGNRYAVEVPAGGTREFVLPLERDRFERITLVNEPTNALVQLAENGALDQELREKLAEVLRLHGERTRALAAAEEAAAEIQRVREDQDRIRENLSTLAADTPLHRRYVSKLTDQEDRLDTLAGVEEAARAEAAEVQRELAAVIRGLER